MQSASVLEKHRQALGILYVVFSALMAFAGIAVFAAFVLGALSVNDPDSPVVLGLGGALAAFLLLLSLPGFIGGIGLLRRRPWSKVLTLIVAMPSLANFPLGTALGLYTVWFWVQPNTERLFRFRGREPRDSELGGPGFRRPLIS
ncbi:MAG TPA: hypothetical protein VEY88_19350 [Archangium sp.]|jgi:hypothetical protein|nr:hypothetical protein [Archangium sp.]